MVIDDELDRDFTYARENDRTRWVITYDTATEARIFIRKLYQWCAKNGLNTNAMITGDVVKFRLYPPRERSGR